MLHFYKTPSLLKKISDDLVWDITVDDKDIYLTFDDGPIPTLTEYVLDVLDDFEAHATFFCVGENIFKYPKICEKVMEKDHIIGNHTFNHLKGWSTKNEQYFKNIEKCHKQILRHQASRFKPLFRPPYGQITRSQINILKEDFTIVMWDILVYDFETSHSPGKSLAKIIKHTKPGSIIVFHDNYKAQNKLNYMLPRFLQYFKEEGYNFKKLAFN